MVQLCAKVICLILRLFSGFVVFILRMTLDGLGIVTFNLLQILILDLDIIVSGAFFFFRLDTGT